jgi:hypothetical protein
LREGGADCGRGEPIAGGGSRLREGGADCGRGEGKAVGTPSPFLLPVPHIRAAHDRESAAHIHVPSGDGKVHGSRIHEQVHITHAAHKADNPGAVLLGHPKNSTAHR